MAVRDILLLGNPALRGKCVPLKQFGGPDVDAVVEDLRETLHHARARRGFGRALAAPQIGILQRILLVDVEGPLALVNPRILRRSRARMLLWDDCFSFPDLLVRVRRHLAVDVAYRDPSGGRHTLRAEGPMAELLQHEIDHLDGILAIDRAIDSRHIVLRSELQKVGGSTVGVL